nr:MAG TPA: hypothetical protein [Caudoviricetes sp.]
MGIMTNKKTSRLYKAAFLITQNRTRRTKRSL